MTTFAEYHLGETGSLSATTNNPQDNSGNLRHFTNDISGAAASVGTAGVSAPGSTAYLDVSGAGDEGWYGADFSTLPTDNIAFGIYARAASIGAGTGGIFTTTGGNGGFKISLETNGWGASAHNVAWIGSAGGEAGSFTADTWVHLAMIRSGGTTEFYIDGVGQGAAYGGAPVMGDGHLTVSPGGSDYFDGQIDEARVVTFTAGETTANILAALQGSPGAPPSAFVNVGPAATWPTAALSTDESSTFRLGGGSDDFATVSDPDGFSVVMGTAPKHVINIVPQFPLSAGTYPLISYSGTIGGLGFASLELATIPSAGLPYVAHLADSGTTIDLVVTSGPGDFPTTLEKTKVLLIEGLSNHDWRHRVDILRNILATDPSLEVEVTLTPATAGDPEWDTWRPEFSKYDVVISGYNDIGIGGGLRWPAEVEAAFAAFVNGGGGFLAFHEANNAFPDWLEYNQMIGLGWRDKNAGKAIVVNGDETILEVAPGAGQDTNHGARVNVEVKRLADAHPIHAGLPDSWMAADLEVYRYARGPAENFSVLTYALDASTGLQFPIEWSTSYGAGRVYVSTYGHVWAGDAQPLGMRCAAFQTITIRAVKWLAQQDPGTVLPGDFPSPTSTSIRAHAEDNSGLSLAPPAVAFNGVLPTAASAPTAAKAEVAFPNLSWKSPTTAIPWPVNTGNSTHLLISEMDGRLFRVLDDDTTATSELVLDIQDHCWEQNWNVGDDTTRHGGLQNVIFHPRFGKGEGKDHIYVFYLNHPTDDSNSTDPYYVRIARFSWNGSSFDSELVMIQQYDTVKGHDGGGLAFGADGFLYISVGDEGTQDGGSTPHSQITDRFRSGLWRIDVDQQGGSVSQPIRKSLPILKHDSAGNYLSGTSSGNINTGYYIPKDNPWVDADGVSIEHMEEFYAIGLRQPHRMTFDPVTGWFWIGDVGGAQREEIDVVDAAGLNFQWNYREGSAGGFRAPPSPLMGTDTPPIQDYDRLFGQCIIGGYVYRGARVPGVTGQYIFGDNVTQRVYAMSFDPATKVAGAPVEIARPGGSGGIFTGISSFGTDTAGEALVLRMGGGVDGNGRIYRLVNDDTVVDNSQFPATLSATNLFTNVPSLTPIAALIPFNINMPLWSDSMDKTRWMMIPSDGTPDTPAERITYSQDGTWDFPTGSVMVKHFARPDTGAPVETRLMVRSDSGEWAFTTYKWRPDGLEADLFESGENVPMTIGSDSFTYRIPSRTDCATCHTSVGGPLLGPRTRQLNRNLVYPATGRCANQVETLSKLGYISPETDMVDLVNVITSPQREDSTISYEEFSRAYLDSNCMHCHQPNGTRAVFDARYTTPLAQQQLICGTVISDLGVTDARIIKPGNVDASVLFYRMNTTDGCCAMPPLAKGLIDQEAVEQLANWILGMEASDCSTGPLSGTSVTVGNATSSGSTTDGWAENMVINESDTYTNTTGSSEEITLDQFSFRAVTVTDPITPFVVRVNGDNDFTILAVGTGRSSYSPGPNSFDFSGTPRTITLANNETIAMGFLDSSVNPANGGSGLGAVTFSNGGDEIYYTGGPNHGDNGDVVEGQAPLDGAITYPGGPNPTLNRDYHFSISFTVGVPDPDTDADGLADAWERVYTPDLSKLSPGSDSDRDGFTDDEERQMGTNPLDFSSRLQILEVIVIDPAGDSVSSVLQTIPGRSYLISLSVDLTNWMDVGTFLGSNYPATETTVIIDSSDLPADRDKRIFIRSAMALP